MAKMLIHSMERTFDPALYHDTYRQRLMDAIQAKIQGQEIIAPKNDQDGNVIDLMEAMKAMLAQQGLSVPPFTTPIYTGAQQ